MATEQPVPTRGARLRARSGHVLLRTIDIVALIILFLGGLNWGVVGIARYDVIAQICGTSFGHTNWISRLIYIIIGLTALYVGWYRLAGLRRPRWRRAPR